MSDDLTILYSKPPSKDIPKRLEVQLCFLRLITQSGLCAHVLYINAFASYGSPFSPATLTALFFSTMILKSDPLSWLAFQRNPWLVMSRNFLNTVKIVQIYFRIHCKVSTVKRKHGKFKRISITFLVRPLFDDVRVRENCVQRSERICDCFRLQWLDLCFNGENGADLSYTGIRNDKL